MTTIRTATLVHEGAMRFAADTGTKRTIVYGDEIPANELSPMETVTVSLAACSAMDVLSIVEKKRQKVESYFVHVEGHQRDEYPRVLTWVSVVHELTGPGMDEGAVRRAIELSALKYCPVNAMLSAGATEVHHRYRIHDTGPEPRDAEGEVVVTGPYRRPDIVP